MVKALVYHLDTYHGTKVNFRFYLKKIGGEEIWRKVYDLFETGLVG